MSKHKPLMREIDFAVVVMGTLLWFGNEFTIIIATFSNYWYTVIMSKVMVYLDNCAYNRPFDDQRQMRIFLEAQAKLHIQHLITGNELTLACSYMAIYENNGNPHEERRFSIADFFNRASLFVDYDKADKVE